MYITWHSTQVQTTKFSQHKFFTSEVLMVMTTELTVFWIVQFDRYLSLIFWRLYYKYLSQIWQTFHITCWEFSWVTYFLTLLPIGTIFIHHNTHSINFNIIECGCHLSKTEINRDHAKPNKCKVTKHNIHRTIYTSWCQQD